MWCPHCKERQHVTTIEVHQIPIRYCALCDIAFLDAAAESILRKEKNDEVLLSIREEESSTLGLFV